MRAYSESIEGGSSQYLQTPAVELDRARACFYAYLVTASSAGRVSAHGLNF